MRGLFRRKRPPFEGGRPERRRIPLIGKLLMLIGLVTVIYLMITYVIIPVLAMLTVS